MYCGADMPQPEAAPEPREIPANLDALIRAAMSGQGTEDLKAALLQSNGTSPAQTSRDNEPDEIVDLAVTVFLLNGLSAALSHGTQLRFWGEMAHITINVMALIFLYALLLLYFPSLNQSRVARAIILVGCALALLPCLAPEKPAAAAEGS